MLFKLSCSVFNAQSKEINTLSRVIREDAVKCVIYIYTTNAGRHDRSSMPRTLAGNVNARELRGLLVWDADIDNRFGI
jgi:hypothetical protein